MASAKKPKLDGHARVLVVVNGVSLTVDDPKWYLEAKCFGMPDEMFEVDKSLTESGEFQAMKVCVACPVRRDCVVDALIHKDEFYIRGGIKMVPKRGTHPCRICRLPVTKQGGTCKLCLHTRVCQYCETKFAVQNIFLAAQYCTKRCRRRHMYQKLSSAKALYKKTKSLKEYAERFGARDK